MGRAGELLFSVLGGAARWSWVRGGHVPQGGCIVALCLVLGWQRDDTGQRAICPHCEVDGTHEPPAERAGEFPQGPLQDAAETEVVLAGHHVGVRSCVSADGTELLLHGHVLGWAAGDGNVLPFWSESQMLQGDAIVSLCPGVGSSCGLVHQPPHSLLAVDAALAAP